jgi:hypothetical protein
MVKAAGPPHSKPGLLEGRGSPRIRKLLRELESLIEEDQTAASRLVDFVKEKGNRGRGRPPLDTTSRRSVVVTVRLTGEQRERLKRCAFQKGKGVSEFARELIVEGIKGTS